MLKLTNVKMQVKIFKTALEVFEMCCSSKRCKIECLFFYRNILFKNINSIKRNNICINKVFIKIIVFKQIISQNIELI